jgi:hypothetical protein
MKSFSKIFFAWGILLSLGNLPSYFIGIQRIGYVHPLFLHLSDRLCALGADSSSCEMIIFKSISKK